MANKILVIGLDGATFDVINPLIQEGWMPNVKKLVEEGASGTLQSTMPPVTGPAWLAMATGLTPGKTGIYDFIKRKQENGYKFTFTSSDEYKGRAIWDYLSSSGKRVCIVNYPTLYPPYEVNGVVVSGGLGAPQLSNFTYPRELEKKIAEFLGYNRQLTLKDPKYRNLDLFINDLNDMFQRRARCMEYLLKKEEWDFFLGVFPETDWILHMMWKFIDSSSPFHDEKNSGKYADKFKRFWNLVDKAVGDLGNIAGDETNVMIVSDHGFGSCHNQCFRLNAWLKREGYFEPKKKAALIFWSGKKLRRGLKKIVESLKLDRMFPMAVQWGKRATTSMAILVNAIDFRKSIAFDPGHIGTFGGIYINERTVKDPVLKERIKKEISDKLSKYGKEKGLDIDIYTPEELYGSKAKNSMDLIVRVNKGACVVEKWLFDEQILDKFPSRLSFQNGSHRMNGVFIASGPDFVQAKVKNARLWDIAPTILCCLNEPIPSSMEGVVLREAIKDEEKPRYEKKKIEIFREPGNTALSRDEEDRIRKQLSDLGYL